MKKLETIRLSHQSAVDNICPDYFMPECMEKIAAYLTLNRGRILEVYVENSNHVATYMPFDSKDPLIGHGGFQLESSEEDLEAERDIHLGFNK